MMERKRKGLPQRPRWQPISISTLNLIFQARVQVDYEVDEVIGCAEITQKWEESILVRAASAFNSSASSFAAATLLNSIFSIFSYC
jgi:hypothetical protein